jgi:hypothetical protein
MAAIVANHLLAFSVTDLFPLNLNAVIKHFASFCNVAETGVKTEPAAAESSSNNCANYEPRAGPTHVGAPSK